MGKLRRRLMDNDFTLSETSKKWKKEFISLLKRRKKCEDSKLSAFSALLLSISGLWVMVNTQMMWIGGLSFAIGVFFTGFFSAQWDQYRNTLEKVKKEGFSITEELLNESLTVVDPYILLKVLKKLQSDSDKIVNQRHIEFVEDMRDKKVI